MINVVSVIIMLHITIRGKPHSLRVHTNIDAYLLAPFVAKKDMLSLHVLTDVWTVLFLRTFPIELSEKIKQIWVPKGTRPPNMVYPEYGPKFVTWIVK